VWTILRAEFARFGPHTLSLQIKDWCSAHTLEEAQTVNQRGSQSRMAPLIIEVCPCYVDLKGEAGGVANIVRQICLHLAAARRQVLLLCGNTELGRVVASPGQVRLGDHLTMEVFSQRSNPVFGPMAPLRAVLRKLPPDCVAHIHTCFSAFTESAMAELFRLRVPFIFTPHGKLSGHMMSRRGAVKRLWWFAVTRRCVQRASAIAVSGAGEAELFPSLGLQRPTAVIPNGYDVPATNENDVQTSADPYVLFLGYLDPRKQPEFLVRAFARSRACQSHRLVIAGPDSYGHEAIVRREAEVLGIQDRVAILGPMYGAHKWALLRNAACLCLPSHGEGLPVVMCEALGAGVPAVYSKACNFPEVQARGAGIELTGFSEEGWANAVDRACLDQKAALAMRAAASRMAGDYSWGAIVARWRGLYDEIWQGQLGVARRGCH
jgi:glycosyltransferase involved in cell wall biosynthesis